MKGNVLMEAEIIDTEAYAEFARKSPEAVAAHGGRVLVRTSDIEVIQGDWMPKRLVVLEGSIPRRESGLARYVDGTMRPGPRERIESMVDRKGSHEALTNGQVDR